MLLFWQSNHFIFVILFLYLPKTRPSVKWCFGFPFFECSSTWCNEQWFTFIFIIIIIIIINEIKYNSIVNLDSNLMKLYGTCYWVIEYYFFVCCIISYVFQKWCCCPVTKKLGISTIVWTDSIRWIIIYRLFVF